MTNSTLSPKTVGVLRKLVSTQDKSPGTVLSKLKSLQDSLGKAESEYENQEVGQWLDYAALFIIPFSNDKTASTNVLAELDSYLATRSYFVGHHYGLADAVIFASLKNIVANLHSSDHEKYPNLIRWFNHIQEVQAISSRDRISFPLLFSGPSSQVLESN